MNSHVLKILILVVIKFCAAQILETPVNVTISDVQTDQFTVSWDSPNLDGSYVEHIVNVESPDDDKILLMINGTELSVDATGLLPGATYNVTVTAVHTNDSLSSAPSSPETQTTVPSAVMLKEYDATTTSVTTQWMWQDQNGIADVFSVMCGSVDAVEINVTDYTLYNVTCTEVTPGRNVTITVSSMSGDQISDNDIIIISAVPEIVRNLTETEATNETFTVSWEAPVGDVEFYEVNCSGGVPESERVDQQTASCIGLTPGENYNITVVAISNGKAGEEEFLNIFTMPNAVMLDEYDATTTYVTAQWLWLEEDGVADVFNVVCGSGDTTETTIDLTDDDTLYNATCMDVTPGRNVTITVSSMSGDKTSDNDTIIISAVPEIVRNLTETGATNETFTVSWEEPVGDVDFYEVSCSGGVTESERVDQQQTYTASCIGLTPGENYNVTVVAISNRKAGEEVFLNIFTMPSAVVLDEYDATTTSVTAQWSWLEEDGVAVVFNVVCGSGDTAETTIDLTDDETLYNATCMDVTPGRNVTIIVSSMSGDKTSENNTIIISAVPEIVRNLTETGATNETFTVSWEEPVGDVDFYEVSCSGGVPESERVDQQQTYTASCIGLTPGENYNVTVVAISNGKAGEEVFLNIFTMPSAVVLDEYDATTTSVTAQWSWLEEDGVAVVFNVVCGSGDTAETTIDLTDDETLYNATCMDVTPGRNVTIIVSSMSGDKTSENNTIIISAVPEIVRNLTETGATNETFTVSWEEPVGDVDFYEVSCSGGVPESERVDQQQTYTASCIGLTPGENYNVTVVAISNGKAGEEVFLNIFTMPSAVVLDEYDATTTSVTAQWSWLEEDGVAVVFNVVCGSGDTAETTIDLTDDETLYNATCMDVTPGRNVTIIVSSMSGDKTSENNTIIISAVPEIVRNLTETGATNETFTVSWEEPVGDVDFYEVSCSGGVPESERVDQQQTYTASCIGLTPGENYNVTVVAISNGKAGEEVFLNIFTMPSAVVLDEYDATTTSVTAQWTWLEKDGVANVFNVICGNGNATETTIDVTDDDILYNATCMDVTPGRNVTITVSSMSGDKTSDSDTVIISAVPEMVANLRETGVTNVTIMVSWDAPDGDVDFYQLYCRGDDSEPERVDHDSTTYSASCLGLIPGEEYTISVSANSNGKEGETDSVKVVTTPNSVALEEGASTTSSVTALWRKPSGTFDSFNVSCGEAEASPSFIPYEDISEDTIEASCINVEAGSTHNLTVITVSDDETSSNYISLTALPAIVQNLTETETTNETIAVSWKEPVGDVDFYNLYCPEDATSIVEHIDNQNVYHSASCTELTPGQEYVISVSANSNGKEGESVSVNVVTIPNSVKLQEGISTTNSVKAIWKKPFGVFESFSISCGEADASPSEIMFEDISPEDAIEASCINVMPGSNHTLEVTTVSEDETSSNSIVLTALPQRVNLVEEERTTDSIMASWEAPVGEVDKYHISCSDDVTAEPETVNRDADLRASCIGLTPGVDYDITVVADSNGKIGAADSLNLFAIPEKPLNLVLDFNKRYINATWERPIGGLTGYSAVLTDSEENSLGDPVIVIEESAQFDELAPNTGYMVIITTLNGQDVSESVNGSGKTKEAAPVEPVDQPTNAVSVTKTSFTVEFSNSYFDESNGVIKTYTVIVSEESEAGKGYLKSDGSFRNWPEARTGDKITPYQALDLQPYFPEPSQRKKRQATGESVTIIIGEHDCKGNETQYCNHKLKDNREYVYKYYACTDGGCSESPYSESIKLKKDYTLIIVLSVVGGVLLILVVVVLIVIIGRRSKPSDGYTNTNGYNNEGFPMRQSIKSKSHSKPVRLMLFSDHFNAMKADSEYRFSEEYEDIREVGIQQAKEAAISPNNRTKNRFTNILPYDHTRVKLSPIDDEDGSDYINANYMPGYNSPREFIACQGPLPATEDDMWKLIWEQHVATIVMVTQLTERGRVKCHHYWPFDNNPTFYGEIMVTIEKESNFPDWTIREFKLECNRRTRHVRHFNYLAWPDHGVPESTDTILKFVSTVRRQIPKDGTPTLVHCSAGVGRTGTFVCLDRLVQHMREHDYVDIFGIVCEMRMSRNLMVQTEKQYIFIHQCVLAILQGGNRNTRNEAIYENGTRHKDVNF